MARGWRARLGALGQALIELLTAELEALGADLRGSANQLKRGAIWLAVAGFFGFWTVGALFYGLIEVLALWLPRWGAVLSGTGAFLLLTLVFVLVGRACLVKIESPVQTVSKRIESHRSWLREDVLPGSEPE